MVDDGEQGAPPVYIGDHAARARAVADPIRNEARTMMRTTVAIGEDRYLLAQGHDLDDLKTRMSAAVRDGGAFVDFVAVGNRTVSVLMTSWIRVVFTVETVQFDSRDTGDVEAPFGTFYDEF